jgi:antitoxin component of MazEF toxin-antitoxin module
MPQLALGGQVEIAVQGDQLVIRSTRRVRAGWEEQFRAMHERGDDRFRAEVPSSDWDAREWQW